MAKDILDEICDDSECIKFILEQTDKSLNLKDDDVQYVLDLIYEYYANNEMMDDSDEVAEIAEDDMLNFVMSAIRKEKIMILTEEQVAAILDGEYKYGVKTGLYE
ncbi:MAG: hypothetical protein MJZ95_01425 [Paludibacteraceae bacterium]|nr:hypothetical protein [Paludibacteraceae bacterium]